METITLSIKKEYTPDVLVCGLGPAGLAAAQCLENNVSPAQVDINKLRAQIVANNGILTVE